MKKKSLFLVRAVLMVAGSMFLQSCESENIIEFENENIERVARSSDFQQLALAVSDFMQTFSDAMNAMPLEEKAYFLESFQNEETMMHFLENNNLIEGGIILQEYAINLVNNSDFLELRPNEQQILYKNHFLMSMKQHQSFSHTPRLRNGFETPWDCEQIFQREVSREYGIAAAAIIACAVAAAFAGPGFPIAFAVCSAAYMAIYYTNLARLEEQRDRCIARGWW